jgi:hypothetical protein
MKEIAIQLMPDGMFRPFSQEDKDVTREFKPFQVFKTKLTGTRKKRSYEQLKLFFACCQTVADNTDDPQWSDKYKVAFQVKVGLHFVNPNVVAVRPDGQVVFEYRSISYKSLAHMEACNFFNRALEFLAKKLNITVDELVENTDI